MLLSRKLLVLCMDRKVFLLFAFEWVESTNIVFDAIIKMLSTNLSLIERCLTCISQLILEKENKLIFKRFILSHIGDWSEKQTVLLVDCLFRLIESRMDMNLLSILFSLLPKIHFTSYAPFLQSWSSLFTSKPCTNC